MSHLCKLIHCQWKLQNHFHKKEDIQSRGEGCLVIGDWNHPDLFTDKDAYATKQLKEWIENEEFDVKLLNDATPTRIVPTGGNSVLDLAVVSKNKKVVYKNLQLILIKNGLHLQSGRKME